MIRIALNGFGRIGKTFVRALLADQKARQEVALVAINVGPADPACSAYIYKYDTILGTYQGSVDYSNGILTIDDYRIAVHAESDINKLSWADIDWVVDATGYFTKRKQAELHLKRGASSVLITAPAHDEDITIIPGINHALFNPEQHRIVSLGSCTTNALVPLLHVIDETFGINQARLTTVHAYTNSQKLLDVDPKAKNPRLSRAAALNIIPTTTGAMAVLDRVMPSLKGKVTGSALRVPVPIVSLVDCTFVTKEQCTTQDLCAAYVKASKDLSDILKITYDPVVSSDLKGDSASVIIDMSFTSSDDNVGKVYGWYDNEWGYSCRLKDFLVYADSLKV
jgi:glyceraldehyde 3-phosphate dehydrogenase (phosphorylating)